MRCRSVREWLRELTLHPTPRKIADYLRGEVLAIDEAAADDEGPRRRHLRRCAACRSHVMRALQYWSLLALYCRDVTPGAAFEARIAARIRAGGAARPPATGAIEAAGRASRRPREAVRTAVETSSEERGLYREAAGPSAVMGWLLALSGAGAGSDGPLAPGENVIGSDPSCDIVVRDPAVSPRHASVICAVSDAGLACFVLDHASRGGTFVNGGEHRVAWSRLEDGDTLRLGDVRLKFKALAGTPVG